jgi:hypothetical protein
MNEYIKKLQSKPEDVRKRILVGSLIGSMAFVALVWGYNLSDRFNGEKAPEQVATSESNIKPFELFTNSIGNTYKNITASVGNIFSKKEVATGGDKQIDLIVVEHSETQ